MKSYRRIFLSVFYISIYLIFITISISYGQSIAIDYGIAGVENFNPTTNYSFSFFFPLSNRLLLSVSYCTWKGKDQNYKMDYEDLNEWSNAFYYGNDALNFLALYDIYRYKKLSMKFGGGLGGYQRVQLDKLNNHRYFYVSAFTMESIVKYRISRYFSIYVKGFIGFEIVPTYFYDIRIPSCDLPRWGFLNVGMEYDIKSR